MVELYSELAVKTIEASGQSVNFTIEIKGHGLSIVNFVGGGSCCWEVTRINSINICNGADHSFYAWDYCKIYNATWRINYELSVDSVAVVRDNEVE